MNQFGNDFIAHGMFCLGAPGPPQFLTKRSESAEANENLSRGFTSIWGIAPGVAPRIAVFVLIKKNLLQKQHIHDPQSNSSWPVLVWGEGMVL